MKYLFLMFYILFLFACSGTKEMPGSISTTGIDFTNYTKQGFFITTEIYPDKYESIGILSSTVWPEVSKVPDRYSTNDGRIVTDADGKKWFIKSINYKDALDELYSKAIGMGADALMKFDIKSVSYQNGSLTVDGIQATGFAIKRTK